MSLSGSRYLTFSSLIRRNLPEKVLPPGPDQSGDTGAVVGGHVAVGAPDQDRRLRAVLCTRQVGRARQLVGHGDPGRVHLAPSVVPQATPILERLKAGAPDRDIGLAVSPGPPERVGDQNPGRDAGELAQPRP